MVRNLILAKLPFYSKSCQFLKESSGLANPFHSCKDCVAIGNVYVRNTGRIAAYELAAWIPRRTIPELLESSSPSSAPKIIYVHLSPKPPNKNSSGGAELVLDQILRRIVERGDYALWICCTNFDTTNFENYSDFPYYVVKVKNYFALMATALKISLIFRNERRVFSLSLFAMIWAYFLFQYFQKTLRGISFHFKGRTMLTEAQI